MVLCQVVLCCSVGYGIVLYCKLLCQVVLYCIVGYGMVSDGYCRHLGFIVSAIIGAIAAEKKDL